MIDSTVKSLLEAMTPEQKKTQKLLMTLPGIGKVHAATLIAEIGNIHRFSKAKSLCNWAGLTPRVRNSDQIIRHGRISKQGSSHLRGAMTQAAVVAGYRHPYWRKIRDQLLPRCGKKGANVAVARRLLTIIFYMWKRQEPYRAPQM